MITIKPSNEQINIINSICDKKNVVVNAVAGSGKTLTVLLIAQKLKNKKILQLTYNKQLKNEVRKKADSLNINNIDIQTYHSLAVKYYDPNSHTDDSMAKILSSDMKIKYRPLYDIVVIDEVQDMTQNYYELIFKFIQDIGFKNNLLILGDSYQGVYEFKNADIRYLLFSEKLWNRNDFMKLTLNQSFRLTNQISSFVNKVMLGNERINSDKRGNHPVYYYRMNIYNQIDILYKKIFEFLAEGYNYDDIFILSPSLKSQDHPCKKLENLLVKNNIPIYFTRNEEDGIDEKIIAGKIVFTTFHQAKGRERKIVFVFGFDESYFDLYAKDKNKKICPSELYVAVTRASDILIIIENELHNPLPFLKRPPCILKKYVFLKYISEDQNKKNIKKKKKEKNTITHSTTVKELTMYLSEITINTISPIMDILFETIHEPVPKNTIEIPSTLLTQNGLIEDVSDLNGIVIPALYESKIINDISTLEKEVINSKENIDQNNALLLGKFIELNNYDDNSISKYLLMGNIIVALSENIYSKLNQIDSYNWLTQNMIDICFKNLKNHIQNDTKYEQIITHNCKNYFTYEHEFYGDINIAGRIDAYNNESVWEFKCTSNLTLEHLLQLTIYAWLWEKCMITNKDISNKKRKYQILNIRTGEVKELIYQDHLVEEIMELLFINKYDAKFKDTDKKFLKRNKKIREKYDLYDDDVFTVFDIK
jgi:hypothetical protein